MKKFIAGFLAGALIFSAIGVFAVTYVANPVDFKVFVNGKEFVSDPPALEVEGRTYLPLRAMGEALGVPVEWNEELRQAEVGATLVFGDFIPYEEKSWCPDFGKFAGVKISQYLQREDGNCGYFYNSKEITDDTIRKYCNIFTSNGYEMTKIDGGYAFVKEDEGHSLAIGIDSEKITIAVRE